MMHLDWDRLVCLVGLLDVDLGGYYVGLVVQVDADLVVCLVYLDVVAYLALDAYIKKMMNLVIKWGLTKDWLKK